MASARAETVQAFVWLYRLACTLDSSWADHLGRQRPMASSPCCRGDHPEGLTEPAHISVAGKTETT
jgi:hypothetical protein